MVAVLLRAASAMLVILYTQNCCFMTVNADLLSRVTCGSIDNIRASVKSICIDYIYTTWICVLTLGDEGAAARV